MTNDYDDFSQFLRQMPYVSLLRKGCDRLHITLLFAVTIFRTLEVTVKMKACKLKLSCSVFFHKYTVSLSWTRYFVPFFKSHLLNAGSVLLNRLGRICPVLSGLT